MLFSTIRTAVLLVFTIVSYVNAAYNYTEYIIFPTLGITDQELHQINLLFFVAVGPELVYKSVRPGSRAPTYWVSPLLVKFVEYLRRQTYVEAVVPNGAISNRLEDQQKNNSSNVNGNLLRARALTRQRSPVTELRFVSQPPSKPHIAQIQDYVYEHAIKETYVYHAEVGIDSGHIDFRNRNIEWVYTGFARERHKDTPRDEDIQGHGTCVASKAVGNIYGTAKQQTLVVVKMPYYDLASVGEILDTTIEHIVANGREARSVVLIPWESAGDEAGSLLDHPVWKLVRYSIAKMLYMNITVVCGAGDHASRSSMADTAPAIYADVLPLLAVSSCDNRGRKDPTSQEATEENQLYAPGVDITCAGAQTVTGSRVVSGTSYAAGLTAGVVASLLASGFLPEKLSPVGGVDFMTHSASWVRSGGVRGIWNGLDGSRNGSAGNSSLVISRPAYLNETPTA